MSLLTENNRQYYEGAQSFRLNTDTLPTAAQSITTTFDTDLKFYSYKSSINSEYALNNFKLYYSSTSTPGTWTEYTNAYTVSGNTITLGLVTSTVNLAAPTPQAYVEVATDSLTDTVDAGDLLLMPGATWTPGSASNDGYAFVDSVTDQGNNVTRINWNPTGYGVAQYGTGVTVTIISYIQEQPTPRPPAYFVVQLKKLDGGNYGNTVADKAYGDVVEDNFGSYAYTKLNDVINNFLVAYVGAGKLIPSVKRTDVIFHAKRAMQEFSYDTLKSVKSQELNIPHNLSVPLPQDYVNYVRTSWIDNQGVQHIIMPTNNLTTSPYEIPLQDDKGVAMQDNFDNNVEGTSIVEERWRSNYLKGNYPDNDFADNPERGWEYYYGWPEFGYGQLYGLDPQYANINGYFNINEREGKMSFSANLVDKLIVFEYISDGLSTDLDTRIPKLAEEAIYAYLKHAILATRINQPEYIIQRLKKESSAQLRNAKIRLSNIKLDQIVQVMRGKAKWIKH